MARFTTIAKLKIGDRFSFVPSDWYGQCRLTSKSEPKTKWDNTINQKGPLFVPGLGVPYQTYDIKYDANVVNPPGVIYGIHGSTKVRLLGKKARLQTKGHHAGYYV